VANQNYLRFANNADFAGLFVIWQDPNFERAPVEYCRQVRDQFGLTMPVVVYTQDDGAEAVGLDRRHVHLVSGRGARITHRAEFEDQSWIEAVEALLR
jgi:hypothetical protein